MAGGWSGFEICEGEEEGDEVALFGIGELEPLSGVFGEIGVEGGIAVDAGAVVSDDGFEGGEATVVHVGGGAGEVAEARGDELAGVGGISGDGGEAGSRIG